MIISRTPLRISFFGGGTDYPAWFNQHGGSVLAATINKYIYITCRILPPFFAHKSRIVWSQVELVNDVSEIRHPSVRECLKFTKVKCGVEIHYDADLPSRSGLGSSSTFTVGLLNSLYALNGRFATKGKLAKDAIFMEQRILKENVGCQDQVLAAFGGINLIEFKKKGGINFSISPLAIPSQRVRRLEENLMLIFTGFTRSASKIAKGWIAQTEKKKKEYHLLNDLVCEGVKIINSNTDLKRFGYLLHESWKIKRGIDRKISTPLIDTLYEKAKGLGAYGGKLLGAGGGGFLLISAEPDIQARIKKKLKSFLHVPFCFENSGSQIIFYNPQDKT